MKKNIFILLISVLLLFATGYCFPQSWVSQNSGTAESLNAVSFCNANTGFAAGDNGIIIKTANGGNNWMIVSSPYSIKYGYIKMFGPDSVILGSLTTDTILFSTNSGTNWLLREATQNSYASTNCMCFVSYKCGYFYKSGIYATTNAGINWTYYYTSLGTRSVSFVNQQTGWICGTYTLPYPPPYGTKYSEVRKTTNAGANWTTQFSAQEQSFTMRWAFMINANTGIANGIPTSWSLYRTVNGGTNWSSNVTGAGPYQYYNKMYFPDDITGYITGTSQTIKSTSSGANWFVISTPHSANTYKDLYFTDSYTGWLVGTGGIIIKTTSGGVTDVITGNEFVYSYELHQNYPNPFNSMTNVKFQMLNAGNAIIKVFDITGKEVAVLVNEYLQPGTYEVRFDVRHGGSSTELPSGIYFYRLETEKFTETKKLILLK